MAEIARSAVSGGVGNLSGGSTCGDLVSGLGSIVTAPGLAGRATGGPVSPGQAYPAGESGPELFVPTSRGQIAPGGASPARDFRVTVNASVGQTGEAAGVARCSGHVAGAVQLGSAECMVRGG